MYKDIISYELAEGATEERLLNVARQIVNDWMKKQPGFIKWEINKDSENNYIDLVFWVSKEAAKNAEKEMGTIPNGAEWYNCYRQGTISSKNIELLEVF